LKSSFLLGRFEVLVYLAGTIAELELGD